MLIVSSTEMVDISVAALAVASPEGQTGGGRRVTDIEGGGGKLEGGGLAPASCSDGGAVGSCPGGGGWLEGKPTLLVLSLLAPPGCGPDDTE